MEVYQWSMIIYFGLLFLVGSIVNIALLAVYWKNKNYSSVIVFIKALALTDFYVCFTKPIGVIYWALQDYGLDTSFCKVFQFTVGTGYTLTFCMTFLVALDRYLAIYHTEGSLFSVTVRNAKVLVGSIWALCHMGNLIKVLPSDDLIPKNGKSFCAEEVGGAVYVSYVFLAFIFVLCSAVVFWINFQIIQAVKRQSRTMPTGHRSIAREHNKVEEQIQVTNLEKGHTPPGQSERRPPPARTKPSDETADGSQGRAKPRRMKRSKVVTSLTTMLAVVSFVYVATTLPTIIIFFVPLNAEFDIAFSSPSQYALYLLLKYLFVLNSAIKPFVYYAVSRTFREQVRDVLRQIFL